MASQSIPNPLQKVNGTKDMLSRQSLFLLPLLVLYIIVTLIKPPSNVPIADEARYLNFSQNLTHGYYSPTNPEDIDLWFGPGLPIVLVPLVAIGAPLTAIRLTGPLFLFLAVVIFYLLMGLYVRPLFALGCAYIFGLYLPFLVLLRIVYSEPLVLFLIVTSMYSSVRYLREGGRRFLIIAGIALGWAALTRIAFGWVIGILLVIFTVGYVIRRRDLMLRRFASIYAIALLTCVPWLLYTFSLSGRLFYWGNSGGLSLYWMSSTESQELGNWYSVNSVFTNDDLAIHRPFFEELAKLDPIARDAALQATAVANISSKPLKYLQNVIANISRLWFSFPYSFTQQKITTLFYLIPNSFLLVSLIFCIPILAIQWRRLAPETVLFSSFAITAFGLHALLSAYARMLTPIVPILLWLVFYTLSCHVKISFRQTRELQPVTT